FFSNTVRCKYESELWIWRAIGPSPGSLAARWGMEAQAARLVPDSREPGHGLLDAFAYLRGTHSRASDGRFRADARPPPEQPTVRDKPSLFFCPTRKASRNPYVRRTAGAERGRGPRAVRSALGPAGRAALRGICAPL